jgi:hypothetical protein
VVTVSERASHAVVDAEIGPGEGTGSGEQAMAGRLHARLEAGWLLIADHGFYSFVNWTGAAAVRPVRGRSGLPVAGRRTVVTRALTSAGLARSFTSLA